MPKNAVNLNKQNLNNSSYLFKQDRPFKLVSGKYLTKLELAYETYGVLNENKDNVILIHHSLSMSAHAARRNEEDQAGWWDCMIGKDKPLNIEHYYIICINNLGSCFGSTGPNNYSDFPLITIHDMVYSQKLLLDHLGIDKLKLVIGSSMGGMLSLAWLQLFPKSMENLFVAATAARAYPVNIFNRMIQQEVIKASSTSDKSALKIARMLGHLYYRGLDELNLRFMEVTKDFDLSNNYMTGVYKNSELYNYFAYNADKFVNYFDQNSYLCLLNAMDLYDLTIETCYHAAGFAPVQSDYNVNITVAGIDSDILFPLNQQKEICSLLLQAGFSPKFIEHHSTYGHDAFLVEHQEFGVYITEALGA